MSLNGLLFVLSITQHNQLARNEKKKLIHCINCVFEKAFHINGISLCIQITMKLEFVYKQHLVDEKIKSPIGTVSSAGKQAIKIRTLTIPTVKTGQMKLDVILNF